MQFNQFNRINEDEFDEFISIRSTIEKYLLNYKWFIFSIVLMLIAAFLYVRFSEPVYSVEGTVLIKDLEKESSFDNLSSIEDLGLLGVSNKSLENEVQLLKSRTLVSNVVRELGLNYKYSLVRNPYNLEIYPDYPVQLAILSDSLSLDDVYMSIEVLIRSETLFDIEILGTEAIHDQFFNKEFTANISASDDIDNRTLRISLTNEIDPSLIGKKIKIEVLPFDMVVDSYLELLNIEPVNEKLSNVLKISIPTKNRNKGIAVVNNLIEQYNADGIKDKGLISQSTVDFLETRLELIASELKAIEETAAQFKTSKGMIDSEVQANYYLQSSTATEGEIINANTQLQLVAMVENELDNISMSGLLPTNIGLDDPGLESMIGTYNELVLRRNRILNSSSEMNPIIKSIDSELMNLRTNLRESLNNLKSSSEIQINSLSKRSGKISSRIAAAPTYEKEYKDIIRQQETKNALYLFLLEKREESILSNAVKVNKSKVIDAAYSSSTPIFPKKSLLYLAAIFLGILIPIAVIYIYDLLDTKVHEEKDLKKFNLPYIGDVPFGDFKENFFVEVNDRSRIAEAFRYLRTNINFMLDSKEKGKTIFITSTVSSEGKSFTAINLARSLALSSKKTLLVGMDLRSPKIMDYLKMSESKGVSNFIHNSDLEPEEIIRRSDQIENLFIVPSGDIPPNPVELLMSNRVNELFDYFQDRFDYIIVDTAPVGMVTDTIQIGYLADLTIFVIKAGFLDKRMLHIVAKLNREEKLKNLTFLINGSKGKNNSHYGYGYSYGYGRKDNNKWFKNIFNKAAF